MNGTVDTVNMRGAVNTMRESFPDARLLMRELTHRISNEFASAMSMVSIAASRCADQEAQTLLSQVQERLDYYARVHHALQMPELGTSTDVSHYLGRLCQSISRSKLESRKIKLVVGVQPLMLPSEQCWLLGMIVNELITNAARHAFDDNGGTIRIGLLQNKDRALCIVSDNGKAAASVRPLGGRKIIKALAESLDGTFSQQFGEHGSTSILAFPVSG